VGTSHVGPYPSGDRYGRRRIVAANYSGESQWRIIVVNNGNDRDNDGDHEFFRVRLIEQRDEILRVREIGDQAAGTVELDQAKVGRLSRMDALQAQAMSQESNRRREIRLRQIDAALGRVNTEEYGRCIDCDEDIARRRLEFDPAATRCLSCAEKIEQ
jgi:DnaK suppressor protein